MVEESLNEDGTRLIMEWSDRAITAARAQDMDILQQVIVEVVAADCLHHLLALWMSMLGEWGSVNDQGMIALQPVSTLPEMTEDQWGDLTGCLGTIAEAYHRLPGAPPMAVVAAELDDAPWSLTLSVCATFAASLAPAFPAHLPASAVMIVHQMLGEANRKLGGRLDADDLSDLFDGVIGVHEEQGEPGAAALRRLVGADPATADAAARAAASVLGEVLAGSTRPGTVWTVDLLDDGQRVGELDETTPLDAVLDPFRRGALIAQRFASALADGDPDRAWAQYELADDRESRSLLIMLAYWVGHTALRYVDHADDHAADHAGSAGTSGKAVP